MEAWVHLHLPRLQDYRKGGSGDVLSIKTPGQKIRYGSTAVLRNARFHVSESGRQRCIRDNVRNVHAWVVGKLIDCEPQHPEGMRRAVYCPWKGATFVDLETKEPVFESAHVLMIHDTVWYS